MPQPEPSSPPPAPLGWVHLSLSSGFSAREARTVLHTPKCPRIEFDQTLRRCCENIVDAQLGALDVL